MKITRAEANDEPVIRQLLTECGLPCEDLTTEHLPHFFVCRQGNALIGVVGLQPRGVVALLRSLAVAARWRDRGLGRQLVARAEEHARAVGVESLYLLTVSAEKFFARGGYKVTNREAAPKPIQETEEFASICPSSSVCMVKRLAG